MDFDEDEYLEKTAENLVLPNDKSPAVADNGAAPSDRDRTRNSLHRDSNPSGKEGEYHRDSFRHRERSPSSHQETSSSLHRKRLSHEEEHERREKSRELRERESGWESRRFKESKEVAEPEAGLERDQRTVFAFQIALKANERDVYDFFSRAGKVRDVRLIMDRNSRRSKGVGYIEFFDALSVPMAIALSGQLLLGQPVMVKLSEAGKNLAQSNATIGGANGLGPYSGGARRLYVGNLHFTMTEEQLLKVFEPFGTVEMVQLPRDLATGFCKGYGFIQFEHLEDARAAIHLNEQREIAGRTIKVSAMTDQVGLSEVGADIGDLDDDEGRGLSLNACSRALLMQNLDRTATVMSIPDTQLSHVGNAPVLGVLPVVPAAAQPADTVGTPTECLLLKNLFDPTVETEQDFDLDIKEDVETECAEHGTVKHIFVDRNSAGHVYVRYDSTSSAMRAQRALHGTWFAGNPVTAMFLTPQNYEMRFPCRS